MDDELAVHAQPTGAYRVACFDHAAVQDRQLFSTLDKGLLLTGVGQSWGC